jgi:lysophospholipid acyltransferase (LPLAT)-like uncharacterized protein
MKLRAFFLSLLVRLLALTWRIQRLGDPEPQAATRKGPAVLAVLHGEQLPLLYAHRGRPIDLMVSRSRDGEWLTQIAGHFGYGTIRGSSSRGAVAAFLGARRAIEKGRIVAIAVDGPRGPAGRVQPGAQALAQKSGVPLISIRAEASRAWRLSSWDQFMIPKPFARVVLRYHQDADLQALQDPGQKHEPSA